MNSYFFIHRGTDFVIYAKDIPDAFNSWKRLHGRSNFYQSEFEKILKPDPESPCMYLVGDSLTKEEIRDIIFKKSFKSLPKKETKIWKDTSEKAPIIAVILNEEPLIETESKEMEDYFV